MGFERGGVEFVGFIGDCGMFEGMEEWNFCVR